MVFNVTFINISAMSWRSVLLVEETGGPGENHRPVTSHWWAFLDHAIYCTLLVYVEFRFFFVIVVCGLFEWKRICADFLSFAYICIAVGEGWDPDPINRFNHATLLCLSKDRIWISNVICRGLFCVQWCKVKVIVRFVDIGENFDHHCLSFFFYKKTTIDFDRYVILLSSYFLKS